MRTTFIGILNTAPEVAAHSLPHGRGSVTEPRASASGHPPAITTLCLIVAGSIAFGQGAQDKLTFEVASVRPSNRPNARPQGGGGPGSPYDPERLHLESMPMRSLLMFAYGLDQDRIYGPGWLGSETYDIDAKIARGATKEQFNVMLQNLLAERFGLKAHHETREFAGYDLVVAKNGPKLAESPPGSTAAGARSDGRPKVAKDKDGLPELAPGRAATGMFNTPIGTRMSVRGQSLSTLAGQLKSLVKEPVRDQTGLTGKYDFNLTFSLPNAAAPAGVESERAPDLFIALEEQLGLKLAAKKLWIDVLVIDRLEKSPTEN